MTHIDDIIPNYDELTVDAVLDELDTRDLSPDELHTVRHHERTTKDRVTILRPVVAALEATPEPTEATVVPQYQYAGGQYFDSLGETRRVEYDRRVKRDVENGRLQLVEKHYPETSIDTSVAAQADTTDEESPDADEEVTTNDEATDESSEDDEEDTTEQDSTDDPSG